MAKTVSSKNTNFKGRHTKGRQRHIVTEIIHMNTK